MFQSRTYQTDATGIDAGLRSHMLRVYNLMTGGLALGAAVGAAALYGPLEGLFYHYGPRGPQMTGLGMVAMLAPLAMMLAATFGSPSRWSERGTKAFYWTFVALQGIGLAGALASYGAVDVIRALLATTAAFAGLSIWGYTSRRDLSGIGSFCIMGVWGLIAVSLLAMFTGMHLSGVVMGAVGVIAFSGLVAYDTQAIKSAYYQRSGEPGRAAYWGALSLYLDAVNLLLSMLRLTGSRS
jgi:FtsH-binding integral membrane protein